MYVVDHGVKVDCVFGHDVGEEADEYADEDEASWTSQ